MDRDTPAREMRDAKRETYPMDSPPSLVDIAMRHIEAARAEERERCARICDGYGREGERLAKEYAVETADELAARIRAGSPAPAAPGAWTDAQVIAALRSLWPCEAPDHEFFGHEIRDMRAALEAASREGA